MKYGKAKNNKDPPSSVYRIKWQPAIMYDQIPLPILIRNLQAKAAAIAGHEFYENKKPKEPKRNDNSL